MMQTDQKSGEEEMLQLSNAILLRAKTALEKAADKNSLIPIQGTSYTLCPKEKQPDQGFEPLGFIEEGGRSFAIGTFNG